MGQVLFWVWRSVEESSKDGDDPVGSPAAVEVFAEFSDAVFQLAIKGGDVVRSRDVVGSIAAFEDWAVRFPAADELRRGEFMPQGRVLARERREAMAWVIRNMPDLALRLTVGHDLREMLPTGILVVLEKIRTGRGDCEVDIACGPEPGVSKLTRTLVMGDDELWEVFVFGRRESVTTKNGMPFAGVFLDGVGALVESPVLVADYAFSSFSSRLT